MPVRADISRLVELLDDPDENVARPAMAQLLQSWPESGDALAAIQDDSDPLRRRRSHQLQAAQVLRERRRDFLRLITDPDISLIDGLSAVHLQWFDNDTIQSLENLYGHFSEQAARYQVNDLRQLAYFLRKYPLAGAPDSTRTPERYCIGTVLESGSGASSVAAALAQSVAAEAGLELLIVRMLNGFAVFDPRRQLALLPQEDWRIVDAANLPAPSVFTREMLLRFAALMLFSGAVSSDSFRYIHTVAQALTGSVDGETPDYLPYPYGDKR